MNDRDPSDESAELEAKAASWLARRDRGLAPAEQDAYLQWLREDPRHGAAVARLEKTWTALDALAGDRPRHAGARPDPDALARPTPAARRRPSPWFGSFLTGATLAAAASIAGFFFLRPEAPQPIAPVTELLAPAPARAVRVIPGPQRLALADGSDVELNDGGRVEAAFTPAERRVRLVGGEAHFTVAKNPARPFVVDAGAVAVRAIGTAFDVRYTADAVEILVTEGRVQLERAPSDDAAPALQPTPLGAGQRATIDLLSDTPPEVATVTPLEMERALAWRSAQLEFPELPLGEVVAEFNRRNRQQIRVSDAATAQVRVAGRFRADNVDGFVRLLEASFGVSAERAADGVIVLRRSR